jgi:hypothetical protein
MGDNTMKNSIRVDFDDERYYLYRGRGVYLEDFVHYEVFDDRVFEFNKDDLELRDEKFLGKCKLMVIYLEN